MRSIKPTQYSYSFSELGLTFTYPRSWGSPGSTLKKEGSLDCAYTARFTNNRYVGMCASSLEEITNCQNEPACEAGSDIIEMNQDKHELEILPPGAECSHHSQTVCYVAQITTQIHALIFYGFRPDSKTYLMYHNGYLIAFSFNLYDFCFDIDSRSSAVDSCLKSLQTNTTSATTLAEPIRAFDEMVHTVSLSD